MSCWILWNIKYTLMKLFKCFRNVFVHSSTKTNVFCLRPFLFWTGLLKWRFVLFFSHSNWVNIFFFFFKSILQSHGPQLLSNLQRDFCHKKAPCLSVEEKGFMFVIKCCLKYDVKVYRVRRRPRLEAVLNEHRFPNLRQFSLRCHHNTSSLSPSSVHRWTWTGLWKVYWHVFLLIWDTGNRKKGGK